MTSATSPALGPSPLDAVRGLCDDIAEHYKPVTGYERKLVEIGARAYQRYEDALEMERQAFSRTNPLEMLTRQPDLFKAITRYVADAERGWRKALEEIRRAIRQRPKTQVAQPARRTAEHPAQPQQQPLPTAPHVTQASARRE